MAKKDKKRRRALVKRVGRPGAPPGLIEVDPAAPKPPIQVFGFGPERYVELRPESLDEVIALRGKWPVIWVNVDGVRHAETLSRLGDAFGLHGLALEDVAHANQRPKVEEYPANLFMVIRMAVLDDVRVDTEQMSIFLGTDFVLTFQEAQGDCLDPIRHRIREGLGLGRIRKSGPDYLAYAIIDAIVDHYFPILESLGERLEVLEEAMLENPTEDTVVHLHRVRNGLLSLRRATWPLREVLAQLYRGEHRLFTPETQVYMRDCHDHAVREIDMIESYREMAASLHDVYLSSVSNRMNEVMKMLTLIATIFIPLNFIAALYGMNFDPAVSPLNMPELRWHWGYPFALSLMGSVALVMVLLFRRRGWLSPRSSLLRPPS